MAARGGGRGLPVGVIQGKTSPVHERQGAPAPSLASQGPFREPIGFGDTAVELFTLAPYPCLLPL